MAKHHQHNQQKIILLITKVYALCEKTSRINQDLNKYMNMLAK